MAWGFAVADIVLGAAMLILAAVVALLGRRRSIHVWLAVHLSVRGAENILQGINGGLNDGWIGLWYAEQALWSMIGPTGLAFAIVLVGRGSLTANRVAAAIAAACAAIGLAFLVPGVTYPRPTGESYARWIDRPDALMFRIRFVLSNLLRYAGGLLTVAAAARATSRPWRASGYLMGSAMLVYPLSNDTGHLARLFCEGVPQWDCGLGSLPWAYVLTRAFMVIAVLIALRVLTKPDPGLRARPAMSWFLALVVVAMTAITMMTRAGVGPAPSQMLGIMDRVWVAAQPLLLTYGLLKFQVFGLDMRIRWTIRQSTIAAVFVAVFFAVSEGAAELFSSTTGSSAAGIGAAAALVFAMSPLQRVAERVGQTALPKAKPLEQMAAREREDLYREQLEFAWSDGALDAQERRRLIALQQRLALDPGRAMQLEGHVVRETAA